MQRLTLGLLLLALPCAALAQSPAPQTGGGNNPFGTRININISPEDLHQLLFSPSPSPSPSATASASPQPRATRHPAPSGKTLPGGGPDTGCDTAPAPRPTKSGFVFPVLRDASPAPVYTGPLPGSPEAGPTDGRNARTPGPCPSPLPAATGRPGAKSSASPSPAPSPKAKPKPKPSPTRKPRPTPKPEDTFEPPDTFTTTTSGGG